jgi:hypothetical protein
MDFDKFVVGRGAAMTRLVDAAKVFGELAKSLGQIVRPAKNVATKSTRRLERTPIAR